MDENIFDAFKTFLENYKKKSTYNSADTCTRDGEKTSGSSRNSPVASETEDMPINGYTMEMYTSKSRKYTKAKQKFRVS